MKRTRNKKTYTLRLTACILAAALLCSGMHASLASDRKPAIRWVDFDITEEALTDAMQADVETHGTPHHVDWVDLLSALAVKYGGDFSRYKKADLLSFTTAFTNGRPFAELAKNEKLFAYYKKAYGAVLGGMLGEYTEIRKDGQSVEGYGLTAFSPIAAGYYYAHYDDFGASRSYGYKRHHLGHDLMGSVGTPIIAVEAGYVEACGWNQYGGWRIGIRSFDGQRYYYYAHLRKNHPYCDIYEGKTVDAGEVIGYLGMTGYSKKENTNNISVPHLHYGLQLIFSPEQKDGTNQIWIDMYALTNFLTKSKSTVAKDADGEFYAQAVRIPKNACD